jgi:hypothetical protein
MPKLIHPQQRKDYPNTNKNKGISKKEAKISFKPTTSTYHNETVVKAHEPKQIRKTKR